MKYRLKNNWFAPGGVRRKPGIVYSGPDSLRDQLPSGTEILNDSNDVVETVERKEVQTEKVIEVQVKTDADAKVDTKEPETKVVETKDTKVKL